MTEQNVLFSVVQQEHIQSVKNDLKTLLRDKFADLSLPFIASEFFVSGGVIGSLLRLEEPNDIDVYAKTAEAVIAVRNHFSYESNLKQVKDLDDKYREFTGREDGKLITEHAITMKNKIQFIIGNFGTPEVVRSTFDYVHCMPYYDLADLKLHISMKQYDANMKKKLIINDPDSITVRRQNKFLERGFTL